MDAAASRVAYEFGEFRVDVMQRLLRSRVDGEPIALTSKAFETLLYLVEHRGELIDKTTLMKAIWPNVVVEENNLNQSISALRRALGESALEHRFIVTVPGHGYRFVAPVKTLSSSDEPSAAARTPTAAAESPTAQTAAAPTGPATANAPAWLIPRNIAIAVAAAALIAGGVWMLMRSSENREPAESARSIAGESATSVPVASRQRLAVLPFDNLSPDPADAFFTDGLHEEILSTLARRAPELDVISRTTMMGYRLKPKPVTEVANELRASHVLEGSVRRAGDKVRLTLQLIDARNDRHLWSQNYDRTLTDALTLQSEVAREVASQLSVQLEGGQRLAAAAPTSAEAYDLYLKGLLARQFVGPLAPVERYREVEDLFSRVIALDPTFAPAYAQRSTFRGAMFAFNYDVSEKQVQRIRDDIQAGVKLAPDDPEVLAAEALYWSWVERDLPRALATFEAAEAARLADPMFLGGKSILLVRMRQVDEALRLDERLMAIDPGNPFILGSAIGDLSLARQPTEALRMAKRALDQFPDATSIYFSRAMTIFAYTGETDEWRAAVERASRNVPTIALLDQYFNLMRVEHRYADLQAVLDRVPDTSVRVNAGTGSTAYFGVGDRPTAFYRGWTAKFLGDSAAAARHGSAVLNFVAHQRETGRNGWFLRSLTTSGHLLRGECPAATRAIREALELMPPTKDALSWIPVAGQAASTYAWCGAEDEALNLLEELLAAMPGPGPAHITRDPFFSLPLAKNERYRALSARLETEMRARKL